MSFVIRSPFYGVLASPFVESKEMKEMYVVLLKITTSLIFSSSKCAVFNSIFQGQDVGL